MRYVLLPGYEGSEPWEVDTDLVVDTKDRKVAQFAYYKGSRMDRLVEKLNELDGKPNPFIWTAWSDYALDVNDERWEEYHGETFAETTARLFGETNESNHR